MKKHPHIHKYIYNTHTHTPGQSGLALSCGFYCITVNNNSYRWLAGESKGGRVGVRGGGGRKTNLKCQQEMMIMAEGRLMCGKVCLHR